MFAQEQSSSFEPSVSRGSGPSARLVVRMHASSARATALRLACCVLFASACADPLVATMGRGAAEILPGATSQPSGAGVLDASARAPLASDAAAREDPLATEAAVADAALEPEPAPDGGLAAPASARAGRRLALEIARKLDRSGRSGPTIVTHNLMTPLWSWIELDLHDEEFPLTVDILASNGIAPRGIVYMLPGGASNFRSSYLTPLDGGLAQYYRRHGYLVVGISPREDHVADQERDLAFMAHWGMAQHRNDIHAVVTLVQSVSALPFEMLGHSYGAASALDYASVYPDQLQRVVALDIYSIDPKLDRASVNRARWTYEAYVTLMESGVYADDSYHDFGPLVRRSFMAPDAGADGGTRLGSGRYTSKQLLLFGMIYSSVLPGVHTPLTGLPGDWPMTMSTIAGEYFTANVPEDDDALFTRTHAATLRAAADVIGGGLISMAFARDFWAVAALEPAYTLHWEQITTEVVWLNSELGYGEQTYGAELMRQAGNTRVEVAVIPEYGHADMLWSKTASEDVWQRLFPDRP
jgi:pimeloyl-ACP methyl ester carboxylesterase